MSDDFTQLNPGTGGDCMDETGVTYPSSPTTRKRARVQIGDDTPDALAEVINTTPIGDEYGLVTRSVAPTYSGSLVTQLGTASLVSANSETTVASYTVPNTETFRFLSLIGQGDVDCVYAVYLNTTRIFSTRTSVAQPTTFISWVYSTIWVPENSTISVTALHTYADIQANFEVSVIGHLVPNANGT